MIDRDSTAPSVEYPACPGCGNEDIPAPLVFETSSHSEGSTVGLSRCPNCRVYFTRPRLLRHNVRPREAEYEAIRKKYEPEARSGRFHKNGNYRYYLRLATDHLRSRRLSEPYRVLDIGSHCGFFLRYARQSGWEVRGIEPAEPMVRFAKEINGVEAIQQGLFEEGSYEGENFHLVTMFDVLEHIADPVKLLEVIHRKLRPGGLAICKVPHIRFYVTWRPVVMGLASAGLLPRYPTYTEQPPDEARTSTIPPFFDLFEHVVHYDDAAVEKIFSRAGFQSTRLLPAPPTNPRGEPLNFPRTATYWAARALHPLRGRPGALCHGLIILGFRDGD